MSIRVSPSENYNASCKAFSAHYLIREAGPKGGEDRRLYFEHALASLDDAREYVVEELEQLKGESA